MTVRIGIQVAGQAMLEARVDGALPSDGRALGAVVAVLRSGAGSPEGRMVRACLAAARGKGLVTVEIDMRGTGRSTGVLIDDHLPLERTDLRIAIARLSDEPWWPGRFALVGIGEAANAAFLAAVEGIEGLSAIALAEPSLDRRRDCGLDETGAAGRRFIERAAAALGWLAAPPEGGDGDGDGDGGAGPGWRLSWFERLRTIPFQAEAWIRHPLDDGYWQAASVAPRLHRIAVPVFATGSLDGPAGEDVRRIAEGIGAERAGAEIETVTGNFGRPSPFAPTASIDPAFPAKAAAWLSRTLLGREPVDLPESVIEPAAWSLIAFEPACDPGAIAAGWRASFARGGAAYEVEGETRLVPQPRPGLVALEASLTVREDARATFERRWSSRIEAQIAEDRDHGR